ncbi:MAG: DegT/DnrJ/EryC1/StrS family aminotransferase, partial [Anaerolineales bacterium]|nr:DegT/DnrJ/EryC1/StrS family aminotransferase [Anaerolineales bacterium]
TFPLYVKPDAPFMRHELTRFLEMNHVETRLIFAGNITKQPGYQHIQARVVGDLAVADEIMRGAFFIGVFPGLDIPRLDYIIDMFAKFFQERGIR